MAAPRVLSPDRKAVPPREHRFGSGAPYLLGVEEELMLLGAEGELVPAVEHVAAAARDPEHVKAEFLQSQIELATTPVRTCAEVLAELRTLRRRLLLAARAHGVRVAAAGTHPSALAEHEPLTRRHRYRELMAELRYAARRNLCFGLHVHVAVDGADKAIAVVNDLVPHLPLLLAVSASSPFWRGEASGLQSTRTVVFGTMPRTGLPPEFADYDEFATQLEFLAETGAVRDHSRLWWDARPHPKYGTVEVRIMDAQPRVEDTAALAALVQMLVRRAGRAYDRGDRPLPVHRMVVAENRWLAVRHGLRAPFVLPGHRAAVPARAVLAELLDELEDDADALEAGWAIERLRGLRETAADRQLRLVRGGAALPDVLDALVAETAA